MLLHNPLNPATGLEDPTQLPWTSGNPATGTEGSYPPLGIFTDPQAEIVNTIVAAGITPSEADLGQLNEAIDRKVAAGVGGIKIPVVPTYTGAQGVQIANDVASLNFPGLPGEVAVQPADLVALYSATLPGHYTVPFATLAAEIQSQVQASEAAAGNAFYFSQAGVYEWVVPAGVTFIKRCYVWGGGGGGGSSTGEAGSASGAGGGAFAMAVNLAVTPGETITITVGGGGAPGVGGGNGSAGGTSSFGPFVTATGGAPGLNDQDNTFPAGGGAGGTAYGPYINLQGSTGGVPFAAGYEGFEPVGGAGGGSPGGGATTYVNTNAPGAGGNYPGGGGAGGSVGNQGGAGSCGMVAWEI